MKKIFRKPKPSPPKWFWSDNDNCWDCNCNHRGCHNCKRLRAVRKKEMDKRKRKERINGMEWISVKDRVPTKSAQYLVTVNFHGLMVLFAEYDAKEGVFYDETWGVFYREYGFYDKNGVYNLTAWMPVPKAYDEENPQATIEDTVEDTVQCAFMDLISDSMDGKYKGLTQSEMIEECYERVIDAIRYQQGNSKGER